MSQLIIKAATIIRNRYKAEIDGCFDKSEFFRVRFNNSRKKTKQVCNSLFKKIK